MNKLQNKSPIQFRNVALSWVIICTLCGGLFPVGVLAADSSTYLQPTHRGTGESDALPTDAVFHGDLVEDPCIISPDNEGEIDLGRRESAFFYIHSDNPVTVGIPFKLKLSDCDLSLGKEVKITLKGDPDTELPGLLKVKGTAGGFAIGLQSVKDGVVKEMPINKEALTYTLSNGANTLDFKAYLRGKKSDIVNKTIIEGDYTAMIEFALEYN